MIRLMLSVRLEDYGPLAYSLALIDIPSSLLLATFYVLAIVHRRTVKLHSRYMAATVILLLPPALGRFLVVVHAFMWPVQEMAWWRGFTGWFAGTG